MLKNEQQHFIDKKPRNKVLEVPGSFQIYSGYRYRAQKESSLTLISSILTARIDFVSCQSKTTNLSSSS